MERLDLVVVSGDLTQRGRAWQYKRASEYLESLPRPQLVVPGNHDISMYAFWRRIFAPLARYRRYISRDLQPIYLNERVVVIGINSARSFTQKSGWLDQKQLSLLKEQMSGVPADLMRMVVIHHPFIPPAERPRADTIKHVRMTIDALAECGVDVILSGHLHQSYWGDLRDYYPDVKRSILAVQAGTATSTRLRMGESNAYNVLRIDGEELAIEVRRYDSNKNSFAMADVTRFRREEGAWRMCGAETMTSADR